MTTMTEPTLRQRIEALIKQWDGSHADWCCTKGCAAVDGRHSSPDDVHAWLAALGRGEDPGELPTQPCPGECTCDVGLYLPALRAVLDTAP